MDKKLLFFDGDGTLWYPSATKRSRKPFWIYYDEATKGNYLDHLELTPGTARTLLALRQRSIKTVILSTHPHDAAEAAAILAEKVGHFKLGDMFDEIHATAEYPEAKGEKMLEIIGRHGLTKGQALMIGDSYRWDYLSAALVGVDAILLNSAYHAENADGEPAEKLIDELEELLPLLD